MDGILMTDEYDRTSGKTKKRIAKFLMQHEANHAIFAPRKCVDMPMVGALARESKKRNPLGLHRYVLTLRFKQSKRWYDDEIIHAVDKKNALRIARFNHPNAKIK